MEWWIWVLVGLTLFVAELFIPTGFTLLLFGVSALVLSGAFELLEIRDAGAQFIIFGSLAIFFMVVLKRRSHRKKAIASPLSRESVIVTDTIAPDNEGRGELRGAPWTVRNLGQKPLVAGTRYTVDRVDGLTLIVANS